jgi:hypothetical protein
MASIYQRHIQDEKDAKTLEHHWGYADRVVPCVNDPGSCEYLDAVYWTIDVGMVYTAIMWAVIGGILVLWGISRFASKTIKPKRSELKGDSEVGGVRKHGALHRAIGAAGAGSRRWLLPESRIPFMRNVSWLQVMVFGIISGYLIIFS